MRKFWFLFLISTGFSFVVEAQTDSLRVEKEGDKVFVIHKVASKQTLFSLARRYGTTVKAISDQNPSVANGLQVGQTLKIPYGKALIDGSNVTHTVESGETLFAIASKYGVKIDELKALNNMDTNSLSVGQVLVIKKGEGNQTLDSITPTNEVKDDSVVVDDLTIPREVDVVNDSTVKVTVLTPEVESPDPTDELNGEPFRERREENVVAELIEETEESTKFLALHRTAPKGTVIKVRNVMNDLTVYVRVIGKLPDTTENEGIVIKINKRAYDQLKALDQRFRVDLSYFQ